MADLEAPVSISKFITTIADIQTKLYALALRSQYETVRELLKDAVFQALSPQEKQAMAALELGRVRVVMMAEIEAEVAAMNFDKNTLDVSVKQTLVDVLISRIKGGENKSVLRVLLKELFTINATEELAQLVLTDRPDEMIKMLDKLISQTPASKRLPLVEKPKLAALTTQPKKK